MLAEGGKDGDLSANLEVRLGPMTFTVFRRIPYSEARLKLTRIAEWKKTL